MQDIFVDHVSGISASTDLVRVTFSVGGEPLTEEKTTILRLIIPSTAFQEMVKRFSLANDKIMEALQEPLGTKERSSTKRRARLKSKRNVER
jgi:hypothetical protein